MKLSTLFGKEVTGPAGKKCYILSVYADGDKLCRAVLADAGEKEISVNFKDLSFTKNSAVCGEGEAPASGQPLRLGKPVFDYEGNYLGVLTDMSLEKDALTFAHVGSAKFSVGDIVYGDAVIVKNSARILKSSVKKNGKVIIRRGTPLTPDVAERARKHGEYVQTNLKTI